MNTYEQCIQNGSTDVTGDILPTKMPVGYRLMLYPDKTSYYYVTPTGDISISHWNKWKLVRLASVEADYNEE